MSETVHVENSRTSTPLLETKGLTKVFDANVALDHVNLSIYPGEIVSIIGENGAGKSTFMKLLSGVHTPTEGGLVLQGKPVSFANPKEAMLAGISMVHQELNLIPTLSAAANLFLGKEFATLGRLNRKQETQAAEALLKRVGAKFSPNALCGELSIAEQQLVEIAKAISNDVRVVIFDEPTAVLSEVESEKLFEIIRELKATGVCVLYVSHRLPEVLSLSDRIIVFRDGQKVDEVTPEGVNEQRLAELMVGRPLADIYPPKAIAQAETILKVENLDGVSFELKKGEIIGLGGLIGSGRTELAEQITGFRTHQTGTLTLEGKPLNIRKYQDAIQSGIVYVSEDRKGKGLVTSMSVTDNTTLATLAQFNTNAKRTQEAKAWIQKLGTKVADPVLPITSLSGGNQQKVSLAKWLATQPKVLIIDEPTRGVDVGAKAEIYKLIAELAAQGMACIVVSSEMPELIGLCHRVLVMRERQLAGELTAESLTESKIMMLAAGVQTTA